MVTEISPGRAAPLGASVHIDVYFEFANIMLHLRRTGCNVAHTLPRR